MGRSISAEDQEGPARDPGISRAPTPLHKEVYSHRNYLSNGVLPIRYQSDSFRSLRDLDYLGRRNIPTGSLSRISWTGCDNLSSQSEANGSDLPDEQRDHAGRVVSRGAREQTVDLGKDRREPATVTIISDSSILPNASLDIELSFVIGLGFGFHPIQLQSLLRAVAVSS